VTDIWTKLLTCANLYDYAAQYISEAGKGNKGGDKGSGVETIYIIEWPFM